MLDSSLILLRFLTIVYIYKSKKSLLEIISFLKIEDFRFNININKLNNKNLDIKRLYNIRGSLNNIKKLLFKISLVLLLLLSLLF